MTPAQSDDTQDSPRLSWDGIGSGIGIGVWGQGSCGRLGAACNSPKFDGGRQLWLNGLVHEPSGILPCISTGGEAYLSYCEQQVAASFYVL